jgi:hypothetical protein
VVEPGRSGQGYRIVLDGLARISGCLDLIEEQEIDGAAVVESITLPIITFYLPAKREPPYLHRRVAAELCILQLSGPPGSVAHQNSVRPERHFYRHG